MRCLPGLRGEIIKNEITQFLYLLDFRKRNDHKTLIGSHCDGLLGTINSHSNPPLLGGNSYFIRFPRFLIQPSGEITDTSSAPKPVGNL